MNGAANGTAINGAAKNGAANGAVMNGVVLFDAYDARTEIKLLQAQFKTEQEQKCAKDLQKFLLQKEDNSWLLDDQLHSLISRTLENGAEETKTRILRILALCALKDNFINFLNLDRKDRCIMKHAIRFETLSPNEQKALAMLICNLFSNPQTSSYALYFSEWEDSSNLEGKVSNAQIVVDLAKNCVESHSPILNHYGSGIMYNISTKQVRVLEKPNEQDVSRVKVDRQISQSEIFDNANLDCGDVSHSELSEKKGQFVALKAYDNIVVDICSSLWEALTSPVKDLNNEFMSCCLKTLSNFVHMLDFADSEMAEELKSLTTKEKLSQSNHDLINELLAKFTVVS